MVIGGKDTLDMSSSELLTANQHLRQMLVDLNEKRQHPRFQKQMQNQPAPGVNPAFQEMLDAVNAELDKRKIEHR